MLLFFCQQKELFDKLTIHYLASRLIVSADEEACVDMVCALRATSKARLADRSAPAIASLAAWALAKAVLAFWSIESCSCIASSAATLFWLTLFSKSGRSTKCLSCLYFCYLFLDVFRVFFLEQCFTLELDKVTDIA